MYENNSYPFNLMQYKFPTYSQMALKQFGTTFDTPMHKVTLFPTGSNITIGGIFAFMQYTGYLVVGTNQNSLMSSTSLMDPLWQNYSNASFEDWYSAGIALVLSQTYGRYI